MTEHPTTSAPSRAGFTVWLTGLSGAGKTTISRLLAAELEQRGLAVEVLDGDVVRTHLSRGLGFSREDRDTNIGRIGWVAARLTRHGAAVIVAVISPYDAARLQARRSVEEFGPFVEVWVKASVEECARRDVKGLYARALAGELKGLTGVDDPYEPPGHAEVVADTERLSPEESTRLVLEALAAAGAIAPDGAGPQPAASR
jgi:adenylyl-sulfate kinase